MRIILLVGLIFLLGGGFVSKTATSSFEGEFSGIWANTKWTYKFYLNQNFEYKTEGHYGSVEAQGKYLRKEDSLFLIFDSKDTNEPSKLNLLFLIDGDSCIIDHYLRYDYCKTGNSSKKRLIKYPQIKTNNLKLVSDLNRMLQQILDSKEILEQVSGGSKNFFMEEYFEINKNHTHQIKILGKPLIIKSKEELISEKIDNYIQINDVNMNYDTTKIELIIISKISKSKRSAKFVNKNGIWKIESIR